jgi:flagellar hook-length control protein FliK
VEGANRQAQIQIDTGKLAGSQIRLALAGTRIEAHLLTSSESSRQTLLAAMDRLRERLRARGITVAAASTSGHRDRVHEDPLTPSKKAGPADREDGR